MPARIRVDSGGASHQVGQVLVAGRSARSRALHAALSFSERGLLASRDLPEAEATKVRTKHMHKEDGVAIIGAGPVGLIVAHELLRRNVPIRLLEKRPGPSHTTRAFTLHARSMEMFEHIGVAHRLEEVSLPCPGNVYHFEGLATTRSRRRTSGSCRPDIPSTTRSIRMTSSKSFASICALSTDHPRVRQRTHRPRPGCRGGDNINHWIVEAVERIRRHSIGSSAATAFAAKSGNKSGFTSTASGSA